MSNPNCTAVTWLGLDLQTSIFLSLLKHAQSRIRPSNTKERRFSWNTWKTCTWQRAQFMMLHALLEPIAFSIMPQHWCLDAFLKGNYREISKIACSPGNHKDSCSSKRETEQYYLKLHNEASQAGVRLGMAQSGKKPQWRLFTQA